MVAVDDEDGWCVVDLDVCDEEEVVVELECFVASADVASVVVVVAIEASALLSGFFSSIDAVVVMVMVGFGLSGDASEEVAAIVVDTGSSFALTSPPVLL